MENSLVVDLPRSVSVFLEIEFKLYFSFYFSLFSLWWSVEINNLLSDFISIIFSRDFPLSLEKRKEVEFSRN